MNHLSLWLYRLGQWLALAVAVVVLALLLIAVGHFYQQLDRPFSTVDVHGELHYLDRETLQQDLADSLQSGFLSMDLRALALELESNPWVASAQLRRRWPARLEVEISEERPVARWGERGFLNTAGQPLQALISEKLNSLPLLSGDADNAAELVASYQLLSSLIERSGNSVAELSRDSRGGWQMTTRSGVVVELGRTQLAEKLRRFNTIWQQQLHSFEGQIARVDLRYSNGAAVAWREGASRTGGAARNAEQQFIGRG